MEQPALVLGSSSPYRQALLKRLGIPFQCASPEIDETPLPGEPAEMLAVRLATAKAKALEPDFDNHLIIGSDQVACVDNMILGKPEDYGTAKDQLASQSGKTVAFHTAIAILNSQSGKIYQDNVVTYVQFRRLEQDAITRYLEREKPLDCAGSFKSEGLGICLFESIRSDDPTALIGLPLIKTVEFLSRHGLPVL